MKGGLGRPASGRPQFFRISFPLGSEIGKRNEFLQQEAAEVTEKNGRQAWPRELFSVTSVISCSNLLFFMSVRSLAPKLPAWERD